MLATISRNPFARLVETTKRARNQDVLCTFCTLVAMKFKERFKETITANDVDEAITAVQAIVAFRIQRHYPENISRVLIDSLKSAAQESADIILDSNPANIAQAVLLREAMNDASSAMNPRMFVPRRRHATFVH